MVDPELSQNAFTEKLIGFYLLAFGFFLVTETTLTQDFDLGKEERKNYGNRC